MSKMKLGRGLEAIMSPLTANQNNDAAEKIENISIDKIKPNRHQPRTIFNEEKLQELAESIKQNGLIEPIVVVRSVAPGEYELIAGERRLRASKLAGLTEIRAIIQEGASDKDKLDLALIENIQREDLNPIDEATSISNIIKLRGYTQEEFASKFGKSRSYVTNLLGLLKLPDNVKKLVEKKALSMSHARVLSKIEDEDKINNLANRIITEDISVRDLENLSRDEKQITRPSQKKDNSYRFYEELVSEKLGFKVRISKNKMELYFANTKELEELLERMQIKIEDE